MRTPFTYIKSYLTYLIYRPEDPGSDKCVYFDLDDPSLWHRYFYVFALFFYMRGYEVYFPAGFCSYWKVRNENRHIYLLIQEKIAHFGEPPAGLDRIVISDNNLSHRYFSFEQTGERETSTAYHVPMCQHPMMYYKGLWNEPIDIDKRKRSIFFIGKFDREFYNILDEKWSGQFLSRTRIFDILASRNLLTNYDTEEQFRTFIRSNQDDQCIFIKRSQFSVPIEEMRQILGTFDFFLAAPGVIMPFAHNVIEAMSTGSIPLIQDEYADMFFPPLRHRKEALLFSDADELEQQILAISKFKDELVHQMRTAVLDYYCKYLTPGAVVRTIEENNFDTIYLQGEYNSVNTMIEEDW